MAEEEVQPVDETPVDAVPVTEEVTEEVSSPADETVETTGFPSRLAEVDPSFADLDEDTALQRFTEIREQANSLGEYQQAVQLLQQQLAQQATQPQQPQPATQPEGDDKPWWSNALSPPPYNPESWGQWLDQEGNFKPTTPHGIIEDYGRYQTHVRTYGERLIANPYETIGQPIIDEAVRRAEERFGELYDERTKTQTNEQFVETLEQQWEPWLYQQDTTGLQQDGVARDPLGNKVPSQLGLRARQLITEYRAQEPGASPQFLANAVRNQIGYELSLQQQAAPAPATTEQTETDQRNERKEKLLNKGRTQTAPARNRATASPATAPANSRPRLTDVTSNFKADLMAEIQEQGLTSP